MKRLQRQYKRDIRIIWHGKVPSEQLPDIIKDFHCLVHPAIYLEVFGLNISEALAQNKYVIATRCGGAEMQIHSEDEGMLVNPNDIISLNKAIRFYIDTPKDSNANVKKISEHINDLLTLYSKLAR